MPDENTTPRVGHRSRASPKAREEQFPDTKEKNGLLFCKACNCLLDHMRKKSIDAHLASARHLAKKKAKDEGKELANDIQPEYLNTVWSEEVLRCQTCKRALDHTWKPSVTRHLTACKRKAEHEDDWKPERKKTSSLPTLPPPNPSFLQPSTQLPSTSSQSICPFPKASRSSVTERPTQSLDLSETEKRRDAKFVDDNRAELIQNVTTVMPILDDLLKWGMIHSEAYSNIRAARTSQEQMRELYITLKSDKVKSTFYRILQKKEHNLIQELGGPVCMEVDCYGQTMCIGQSSECLPQAQQNRQTVKRHVADYVSIAIQKHKAELMEKYKHVSEGIGKERDSEVFNKIYTELYIITGESERLNSEHEVSQLEDTSQLKADKINCNDIFKPLLGKEKGEKRSIRTVLMKGIAGIGKTFSVQKFILDWAEGKANQHIDLIFVLPFRELNLIRRPHSVHSLLSSFHPGLKELDDPLYDSPTYKVMIIFDGLDESRFKLDFKNNETLFKITDEQTVNVLLTNIIKRKLLPEALLWITSRPAAANQIPWEYIDQVTVVRGFTDEQKEEYFKKKVEDEKLATRIISHVKMSRSLHLMCQIPIFCWIAAMILGKMLSKNIRGVPKTLTAMYTHFLVTLTDLKGQTNHTNPQKVLKQNRLLILKLGRLAFNHLGESQMFYENDLADCGITDEEREGSLYSAMFTEIFKKEDVFYGKLVYYFVHLTIQEFFASLFVFHCFISNEMKDLESFIDVKFRGQPKVHTFLERVVNKASKSENGHLDLFVRFLHGFLLESNQQLLEGLLTRSKDAEETSKSVEEIRKYLKYMATQDISPERCINLFHCLIEMGDRSLNKDIQAYLSHKAMKKSSVELTPDHCSALASVLLKSGEEVDVFDLKKYKASWEKRRRLVPAVTCCRKALLAGCRLTNETCETVAVALRSANSPLRELDLSHNDLQDSGVKQLSDGLKDPHCQLEILRLSGCHVTHGGCASLASALGSNPSHLRELDLSFNHPGDSGVKLLSARLEDPHCRLEKLNVDHNEEFWVKPQLMKKYACDLTLDPNTAHRNLSLSEGNRRVERVKEEQPYPDHPERFDHYTQVLCREGLTGRCYWEVECSGLADIGVTCKGISRKGDGSASEFGYNKKSWSLICRGNHYGALHNSQYTTIHAPHLINPPQPQRDQSSSPPQPQRDQSSSPPQPQRDQSSSPPRLRVGVFLDWLTGTLSFYKVYSGLMTHLHTFQTIFTEPLYPTFGLQHPHTSVSPGFASNPVSSEATRCPDEILIMTEICIREEEGKEEDDDEEEYNREVDFLLLEYSDPTLSKQKGSFIPLPCSHSWPFSSEGTLEEESEDGVRGHLSNSLPDAMENLTITEIRRVNQGLFTTDPPMMVSNTFEPEIYNHEGKGAYRFQCPSAGLFQCSITGLVFRMEGEGEVLYRTVHWDRKLLSQSGKRPAGPLFNIDCPQKSVCQLHLPHCQIHSCGGCDFLSVAHVTDDDIIEFLPPHETTDTHVIINITGLSAYGDVTDDDAPISPILAHVLLFYQPLGKRSILNVLLLPSNVVRKEVRELIERDGIREILTTSLCTLTPKQEYTLSTNPADAHPIQPNPAKFVDSYENYVPTFQLFIKPVVEEVNLLLEENKADKLVWNGLVWLPVTPPGGATAGTKNVHFLLLDILEELGRGDLKKFQWYINKGVEEFPSISEGQLEDADRLFTVDRMVQSYCDEGAVKITLEILRKMGRNNLAEELKEKLTKQV